MNYQTVILELPNGQTRHMPMNEFDFYAYTNELEHKKEDIIINIGDLAHSFLYETDERGEIINKETISRILFA